MDRRDAVLARERRAASLDRDDRPYGKVRGGKQTNQQKFDVLVQQKTGHISPCTLLG